MRKAWRWASPGLHLGRMENPRPRRRHPKGNAVTLVERLERISPVYCDQPQPTFLHNPDGPEAAALIRELVEAAEEALLLLTGARRRSRKGPTNAEALLRLALAKVQQQ